MHYMKATNIMIDTKQLRLGSLTPMFKYLVKSFASIIKIKNLTFLII